MSVFGRTYGRYAGGTVLKDGTEIRTKTVPEAVGHGIAYVTEDRKHYGLNLIDTINRNISLSALGKVAKRGVVDEHEERQVAEGFRKSMNIKAPTVFEPVGKLSGGNQQKVVLSKWIFAGPDVLILDEPTRGIDVGAKFEIYTVIDQLAAEGKAVVFISSELPELLGMCDRIYTMAAGRLTGEVPRAEATQEVLMRQMTKDKEVDAMSTNVTAKSPAARAARQGADRPAATACCRLMLDGMRRNMRQYGMLIALGLIVVAVRGVDGRRPAAAAQRLQPGAAEQLHPDPRDRHDARHHRGPHRPVGRLAHRVRGRVRRRTDGQARLCRGRSPWCCAWSWARVAGAVQGFFIAYLGIPSFIVTLAGMLLFRGLTEIFLEGQTLGPFPKGCRRSPTASCPRSARTPTTTTSPCCSASP